MADMTIDPAVIPTGGIECHVKNIVLFSRENITVKHACMTHKQWKDMYQIKQKSYSYIYGGKLLEILLLEKMLHKQ